MLKPFKILLKFKKFTLRHVFLICFLTIILITLYGFHFEIFKDTSQHLIKRLNNTNNENNKKKLENPIQDYDIQQIINIFEDKLENNIIVINKTNISDKTTTVSETIAKKKYNFHSTTDEKLWFMTNGSLRPDTVLSEKLAIWPQEGDPEDDRIVNQLMYIPKDYNQNYSKIKKIYMNGVNDWGMDDMKSELSKCPVNRCQFVSQDEAEGADLIFFKYASANFGSSERNPNQIWLLFQIESALNAGGYEWFNNKLNWTATYRHDSEISTPYYKYFPYYNKNDNKTVENSTINYSKGKTKQVVWFVSNCGASNNRLQFAKELQKHINVDIYGHCGNLSCPRQTENECFDKLNKDYKFYLSFENSNCKDYITEKFWLNGLSHNIIPIVMGAHPKTYKRFAPEYSYIHVEDFYSPQHLALYLHELDKNDTLYNNYFKWKGSGEILHIQMWCRICALLHAPKHHNVYEDVNKWWSGDNTCVKTWTDY